MKYRVAFLLIAATSVSGLYGKSFLDFTVKELLAAESRGTSIIKLYDRGRLPRIRPYQKRLDLSHRNIKDLEGISELTSTPS